MGHDYQVYVDDKYIETIYSTNQNKLLRQLGRKYPDAKRIELFVREYRGSSSMFLMRKSKAWDSTPSRAYLAHLSRRDK